MPTRCPFCRCPHVQVADARDEPTDSCGYAVHCLHCGAFGPMGNTAADAIAKWNVRARADDPELQEVL